MWGLAGMKTSEDFPYVRRIGLPLVDDNGGFAEFILTGLNSLLAQADKAGVSFRLRFQDAGVEDRSGDRLAALEWVTASGDEYFIEELDVVGLTEAAELVDMSRSALARRVTRAHKAGRPQPFRFSPWSGSWLAEPADVKAWAESWTGTHAKRRKRASPA